MPFMFSTMCYRFTLFNSTAILKFCISYLVFSVAVLGFTTEHTYFWVIGTSSFHGTCEKLTQIRTFSKHQTDIDLISQNYHFAIIHTK